MPVNFRAYTDDRSHVVAIRDNSEDVVWENFDLRYRAITAPRPINNYVAVADFEGYVHLISQIDGRLVGRYQVNGDGVRANLLESDGTLYVFSNNGSLSALRLQ